MAEQLQEAGRPKSSEEKLEDMKEITLSYLKDLARMKEDMNNLLSENRKFKRLNRLIVEENQNLKKTIRQTLEEKNELLDQNSLLKKAVQQLGMLDKSILQFCRHYWSMILWRI